MLPTPTLDARWGPKSTIRGSGPEPNNNPKPETRSPEPNPPQQPLNLPTAHGELVIYILEAWKPLAEPLNPEAPARNSCLEALLTL